MRKFLFMAAVLLPFTVFQAQAGIEADITSGGFSPAPAASKSELGSKIEMIENDFNLKSVQEAFDKSSATDNVVMYDYAMNKTYAVRMRVNMATMVVLPKWETVKAFQWADDYLFTVSNFDQEDMRNILILQSQVAGVDTNLTVIGESGNIYPFYLRNDPVNSPKVPHFTVYVNALPTQSYIAEKEKVKLAKEALNPSKMAPPLTRGIDAAALEKAKADYLRTLPDTDDIDLDFEVTGDFEIAPRAVFSRHGWTFFDFRETLPSDRLPVIYKIVDGFDAVINSRVENGFLIAETVSTEGWTLRNGDKIVCVRHNK